MEVQPPLIEVEQTTIDEEDDLKKIRILLGKSQNCKNASEVLNFQNKSRICLIKARTK